MIYLPQKPNFGAQLRIGHWSTKGLVGFWPFRKAGNLVDFTPNKNHGTLNGPTWVGDGLSFDGSDKITIGNKASLKNQNLTYMAWIKTTMAVEGQIISMEFDTPWNHLAVVSGGVIRFTLTTTLRTR